MKKSYYQVVNNRMIITRGVSIIDIRELYAKRRDTEEEEAYLASYNLNKYFRPSVSTDIAAFMIQNKSEENYRKAKKTSLSLLLVKRGQHPFKNYWALPGGFMREEESIEECAYREIVEETGIKPISMKPVGVFSELGRDPRGRIISNAFASILCDEAGEAAGGDDAADAKWFDITLEQREDYYYLELESGEISISAVLMETCSEFGSKRFEIMECNGLAFDHAAIISTALCELRKDVLDFDILFDFLPKKFTLLNLQQVQEIILNKTILPANFRRKVADYVEETEEYATGAGHRPAKLYIRRKMASESK